MKEMLQSIILDFQEAALETGVPRHVGLESVRGKAAVCIGVRRCGKSTYMYQRIQRLLDDGISRQNILYLNFFDDRLHNLRHEGLGVITEAYYALYPEKKNKETVFYFFDEIQVLPGWESFVDRVMRTEKCEVYLTGSSARMLSKEVATQMRGRALSWEMFPFSFREYLDSKGIDSKAPMSTKRRLLVQKAFEEYWVTGGFPEIVALENILPPRPPELGAGHGLGTGAYGLGLENGDGWGDGRGHGWNPNPRLRVKIHQEYLNAILFRDLVERHDISHPKAVSDLAHWLLDNTASLYSVNRLTGYLKSLGHTAPRPAVSDYIAWFEDAYFLFSVRVYDASVTRSNVNPKKIYCVDHALVTSVASGILINSGHLLENLVFTALRRVHPDIFYYKTRNGKEVDFIVPVRGRPELLVQVCESLVNPRTRKREQAALEEAMGELGIERATIVTRNDDERIKVGAGAITVVPAWRFLLEMAPQEA